MTSHGPRERRKTPLPRYVRRASQRQVSSTIVSARKKAPNTCAGTSGMVPTKAMPIAYNVELAPNKIRPCLFIVHLSLHLPQARLVQNSEKPLHYFAVLV